MPSTSDPCICKLFASKFAVTLVLPSPRSTFASGKRSRRSREDPKLLGTQTPCVKNQLELATINLQQTCHPQDFPMGQFVHFPPFDESTPTLFRNPPVVDLCYTLDLKP